MSQWGLISALQFHRTLLAISQSFRLNSFLASGRATKIIVYQYIIVCSTKIIVCRIYTTLNHTFTPHIDLTYTTHLDPGWQPSQVELNRQRTLTATKDLRRLLLCAVMRRGMAWQCMACIQCTLYCGGWMVDICGWCIVTWCGLPEVLYGCILMNNDEYYDRCTPCTGHYRTKKTGEKLYITIWKTFKDFVLSSI